MEDGVPEMAVGPVDKIDDRRLKQWISDGPQSHGSDGGSDDYLGGSDYCTDK